MQTSDPEIQFGPIPEGTDSDVLSDTVHLEDVMIAGGDASTPLLAVDLQEEKENIKRMKEEN